MAYAASLAGDNLPHFATRQLACCSTQWFDTAETQVAGSNLLWYRALALNLTKNRVGTYAWFDLETKQIFASFCHMSSASLPLLVSQGVFAWVWTLRDYEWVGWAHYSWLRARSASQNALEEKVCKGNIRKPKRLRANILQRNFVSQDEQISDASAGQHPGPLYFAHGVLASSPFVSVLDPGCRGPVKLGRWRSFLMFRMISDVFWVVPVKKPNTLWGYNARNPPVNESVNSWASEWHLRLSSSFYIELPQTDGCRSFVWSKVFMFDCLGGISWPEMLTDLASDKYSNSSIT